VADAAVVVDAEHPWPWLDAFTEGAAAFFHGRDDDVAALLQAVATAPLTVLFGRSGLGKTSLLQAGLFPRLGERRLFPVLLRRVDHGPGGAELSARWLARLDAEAAARGLAWHGAPDDAAADDRARLWERLHRRDGGWREGNGSRWTPLLVLDQFEEVFTLQADSAARRRVFEELGDLFENRIPPAVNARTEADESLLDGLDVDAQPYRCLLALREDFLAELEEWVALVPRLAAQRLRLLPMGRAQALAAVQQSGGALVDETSARRIVDFLGQRADGGGVEPALLSLVCASLNDERLEKGRARLDVDNLESSGARILDRFYDQAFAALAPALREPAHAWVESDLITAGGTRRPYPREALTPELAGALETLVQRRLLRVENAEHGDFVELVHDRLAAVARQRAAAARERAERAAAEAARARAAEKRRRRWRSLAASGFVLLLFFAGAFVFTLRLYRDAQLARLEAEASTWRLKRATDSLAQKTELAEAAEQAARQSASTAAQLARDAASAAAHALDNERLATEARDAARRQNRAATAFRLAADGQTLASGAREGGLERALLSMLAGFRLAQGTTPQALSAAQTALQAQASSRLTWVRDAPPAAVAALSPDGRLLVTGGGDGVPLLHDGASGEWLGSLPLRASGDAVTALAISPDSRLLVTGHRSGLVRRWDLAQRRSLQSLPHAGGAVVLAAFAGDDLVVVGARGAAVRWNLARDEALASRAPPPAAGRPPDESPSLPALRAALSADGRLLALANPPTVEILDATTMAPRARFGDGRNAVRATALAFAADGRSLVTGDAGGSVQRWDFETGTGLASAETPGGSVRSLAVGRDGRVLAATEDGQLRLGERLSLKGLEQGFKVHAAGVAWSALFDARGAAVTTVGDDRVVTRWQVYASALWRGLDARNPGSVAYTSDGRHIVARTQAGLQRLPLDGRAAAEPEARSDTLGKTRYSRDGRRAVATAIDERAPLRVYDTATGRVVASTAFDPGFDAPAAISDDGQRIAVAFGNRWQLFDGQLAPLGPPVEAFAADADITALALGAGTVVAGTLAGDVARWDLATRRKTEPPERLHESRIAALAISPDGRWLASAGGERRWRLSELRTLADVSRDGGIGHGGPVHALAFSQDGRHLVSASRDLTLRLWEIPAATPLGQPLRGYLFNHFIGSVAFAPDGRSVASTGNDNRVRIWPVLDAWADEVCKRLARNMSRRQWHDWVGSGIDYVEQCPGKPVPADR
jgi:WD40 repeat protein